jgi:Zn-dependent protease/CBS domain-containing protein
MAGTAPTTATDDSGREPSRDRFTFRFATVRGIELRAHVSVLVTVALVGISLGADALPSLAPDQPVLAYIVAAALTGFGFFASLIAHELSHSFVAQTYGLRVPHITLWLLGGAAALQDTPATPDEERRIALAGPGMSIALTVGFGLLAAGLSLLDVPELVTASFGWLAVLNLMLAVFNLFPVFPLDGGRALVAFLWKRNGDRREAVRRAAAVGDQFGIVLIALGVLQLLAGALVGGLWMVFLGWFIRDLGRREAVQVQIESRLTGVQVRDVMTPDPHTVPPGLGLPEFVELLLHDRHVTYPVVGDRGHLIGMVSIDDVRRVPTAERASRRVIDVATLRTDLVLTRPDDPALDLLTRLGPTGARRAVVVADDRPVGIVSLADLTRVLAALDLRPPPPPPPPAPPDRAPAAPPAL